MWRNGDLFHFLDEDAGPGKLIYRVTDYKQQQDVVECAPGSWPEVGMPGSYHDCDIHCLTRCHR